MLKRLTLQIAFCLLWAYVCLLVMDMIDNAASHSGGPEDWFAGIEYLPVFFLFIVIVAPTLLAAGVFSADKLSGYGSLYRDTPVTRVFTSFANRSFIRFIVIELGLICILLLGGKFLGKILPDRVAPRYFEFSLFAFIAYLLYTLIYTGSVNHLLSQKYSRSTIAVLVSWGMLCYLIGEQRYHTLIPIGARFDTRIFLYVFAAGYAVMHSLLHPGIKYTKTGAIAFLAVVAFSFFILPVFSINSGAGRYSYRDRLVEDIHDKDSKAIRRKIDYLAKKTAKGNENARYILSFTIRPLLVENDSANMEYLGKAAQRIGWQPDSSDRDYVNYDHINNYGATRMALKYKLIDPNKLYDDKGFLLNIVHDTAFCTMLIDNGANPNEYVRSKRYYGSPPFSPLNYAVRQDDLAKAGFLLRHGADPNLGDLDNKPICYVRSVPMAKLLMDYGAQPDSAIIFNDRNKLVDVHNFLKEQGFHLPN